MCLDPNSTQEPGRMGQPEGRKSQQDDPDHRAQTLPARIGLLDDHDPGQHRHRHQAAHAHPKHDQHQCPAAPQAERAVAEAQVPGGSYPLAIVAHVEAERAAALLETASLERAELEHTSDREGGRANDPGMGVQPEPVMNEPVDLGISHKSHDDQKPGPENRGLMGRRRWYPLLFLPIRNMHGLHQTPPCSERLTFCARSGNCRGYASHPRWPFSGLYEQSTTQAGILVVIKRVICWAITSPSSSSAK